MRALVLGIAAALLAPALPAHATDLLYGSDCRLVSDPSELRSDVASYHVIGGPFVIANPDVTSVTVTCWVTVDGAFHTEFTSTREGRVGYTRGHVSIGTFSGPQIGVCTRVTWTGGKGFFHDSCSS